MAHVDGPFVRAAFICEDVLTEADGKQTFLRVLDTLTVSAQGQDAPDQLPPGQVQFTLVAALYAGEARGTFPAQWVVEKPSGERSANETISVLLNGPGTSAVLIGKIMLGVDQQGLWLFDLTVAGQLMARVPLRINYHFVRTGPK